MCRDLFDEVAKELGVEVEYLDLPWSSVLPGLEAEKFDIVNAPVTITAERMQRYSFTLPMGNATVALADLAAGRIQAVANSMPLMGYAAVQRPESFALVMPPFGEPKYFAWVARPGEDSASLIEAVNATLLKMHEDGRLAAINEKWLGSAPELPTEMPAVE
ncbi:transporter substrate-binding domain-containing protein [Tropicimonas sp. IMCC6043]|uniref:transporter substrate-binding domain-containing protein n=1 Tax=Tropicimonas sp. IMCC6043 TaxID=2510645 RepID=UPI00210FD015|nr:transporter substrate-binding domain-containing protein [Tropicimonas sp. IMCC6043]